MTDNELKSLWKDAQPNARAVTSSSELLSAMRNKSSELRRSLLARDVRELSACAFIFVIFAIFYSKADPLLARLGDLLVMASAVFIAWKLLCARRMAPAAKPDATIVESLRAELRTLQVQSKLLGSVLWWYLLPIGIGVLLSVLGDPNSDPSFRISFTAMMIPLYAFIYWLNQRARRKQLLPAEAHLQALLHSAETGEPLSEHFIATQTLLAPAPSVAQSRKKAILWNVGETIIALLLAGVGYGAYELSVFFNAVYVGLLVAVFVAPLVFISRVVLNKIYFGLLTKPFAAESVRYWLTALPRLTFFASCGYLLSICVVPFQFPDHSAHFMRNLTWTLAAVQFLLSFMPPRRVSIPLAIFYSLGAAFMIWHFVQIATPAPGEKIILESPLKGASCVVHGGNDPLINHHYSLESQRYALDIFKVAEDLRHVRDWKIMKEDAGFGQTIYSPADGTVANVESDHADNTNGQTDDDSAAGNYITIEVAPNRFVLIAHLKENSPTVKIGDKVKTGQPIAQCGNSGNSAGPHVHIQIQATPDFNYETKTYPIAFRDVLRGSKELKNVEAKRNDLLLNTEH